MFAVCLEASHNKGMGHLFRMLNFIKYLRSQNENFIFFINDNQKTEKILNSFSLSYEIVKLEDISSNWEETLIEKYDITHWINDRLDTNEEHALNIKNKNIKLITFDDLGTGARNSDINICGLFFNNTLEGKKVLKGVKYLILNDEIEKYKKTRIELNNIFVTLGGSDTYGATIKVLKLLKKYSIQATIHIGPSFEHSKELEDELTDKYNLITFVPSLIEELCKYDLAITGGGITPFEANALGLPCLIVANELFEIPNGKYLDDIGSSKFIGYHSHIDEIVFQDLKELNIEAMSQYGLKKLNTDAVKKIYKEIKAL